MNIQEYNKIRRVALSLGFKRNTTDMWFKRKSIPHEVQIKIFEASNGAISFPHMSSLQSPINNTQKKGE